MKKRKRRKLKKKRILLLIIIILIPLIYINNKDKIKELQFNLTSGYSKEAINTFKEDEIYDYVLENGYNKVVNEVSNSKYFNKNYIKQYYKINYQNNDNFIEYINLLLDKKYTPEEINTIYKILDNNNIKLVLEYDKLNDLTKYISLNYFKEDYLKRYIDFYLNDNKLNFSPYITNLPKLDYTDIVTYVNINLDNEYYTEYKDIKDSESLEVLVNKYNKLSSDYEPLDLEIISSTYSYGTQKLRKEAKEKFEEMAAYMSTIGLHLYASSTYRSYKYQDNLYNNYVYQDGKKEADTYSARPGFSEHQTGLAVDVASGSSSIFANSNEYKWMIDNSYKYGYILRYPENKEYITGYMFESWHYRYIGIDIATYLYENKLTYEEYVARNINNKTEKEIDK